MNKIELSKEIARSFNDMILWFESQDDEQFVKRSNPEKWMAGQHALHLLKAASGYNKALAINKFLLRYKFGINNRVERSYHETRSRYKEKLKLASPSFLKQNDFSPAEVNIKDKAIILEKLAQKSKSIQLRLSKWPEKKLTKLLMPHPAMGKMTVRELGCFIAFHNDHHLDILKAEYS